ncbi:MAG: hypothetical protein RL518_1163 [Pseudomonadota bacterium]|jgi:hypothetical protein
MNRIIGAIAVSLVVTLCRVSVAQVKSDKELPKSGNLSTTFNTGRAASTAPEPFGFDELRRDEVSPLTGSISRINPGEWQIRVFNNSKSDTYSVNVEALQLNESLRVVKRDVFTYTLSPNSSKQQSVTAAPGVKGAELNLDRFTNLTARRAKTIERATPQGTPTETK